MSLQDPEFENFKRAFKSARFDEALQSIKKLLVKYPQSFALHWHHARVLEKLERFEQARIAINKVLKLRSDFVPALIMQVQLDFHDGTDANIEDEIFDEEPARFDIIEQRLYKILSIDPNAVDALHMLSGLLRGHEGDAHLVKANQLLNRAISLAPERVDLLEDRGNSLLGSAIVKEDDTTNSINIVSTFSGMRYRRDQMELALSDFHSCYQLTGEHRFGLRVASILHDLGRFNEALAAYDKVLANVPADDPYRPLIIERRARAENDGGGEREHMAQLLESAIATGGKDRSLAEDNVAQVLLSTAKAVRAGKPVGDALEERLSDDPDDNMASYLAAQIMNVANEPHPDLVGVDPKDFPAYQQKFIAKCKRELNLPELHHVADAEALGMTKMLGQKVLLSFFSDETGEIGICCFCMKPKKINTLTSIFLLLTGKWKAFANASKTHTMAEAVSQFESDAYFSTQPLSISPFEYGPPVYIEKLPKNSSAAKIFTYHQERIFEYKEHNPTDPVMRVFDLAGMQQRWVNSQTIKRNYRKSIGFITEPELIKFLGAHYDRLAEKVRAKIKILAAEL